MTKFHIFFGNLVVFNSIILAFLGEPKIKIIALFRFEFFEKI